MTERLEEITSSVGISLSDDGHVLLRRKHYEWLIEQAKRVQALEFYKQDWMLVIDQNKRYREALEEIVHQENLKETNVFGYDHEDISSYVEEVARKALEDGNSD